jgi:hypothetical protein
MTIEHWKNRNVADRNRSLDSRDLQKTRNWWGLAGRADCRNLQNLTAIEFGRFTNHRKNWERAVDRKQHK